MAKPEWVNELWCIGCGYEICSRDKTLPISKIKRVLFWVYGNGLMLLFGWWHWTDKYPAVQ